MMKQKIVSGLCYILGLFDISSGADAILPNPPLNGFPVIAKIDYQPGDLDYRFQWFVNNELVITDSLVQTLHLNFDHSFLPEDGKLIGESTGAIRIPGRFGFCVYVGSGTVKLSYPISALLTTCGSISLWFALDKNIEDALYDNWTRLVECRIDNSNALYIEIDKDINVIKGVSQRNNDYFSTMSQYKTIRAKEWHHLVWTWDTVSGKQNLYFDGNLLADNSPYQPPIGEPTDLFIGSAATWSGNNAFACIDEVRLFCRMLNDDEIQALNIFPVEDIDAFFGPSKFKVNDQIDLKYQRFSHNIWGESIEIMPVKVIPTPVSAVSPPSDVLPAETQRATFRVTTREKAICKCACSDILFSQMRYIMQSKDGIVHDFSFTTTLDQPAQWFIRCSPENKPDNPWPVVRTYQTHVLRDYAPSYPRIMSLWWTYKDPRFNSPAELAKYDLVVLYHGYFPPEDFFSARRLNPHLKILNSYSFSYGGPEQEMFILAANNPSDSLFNCVLCDPNGKILYTSFWGHPLYNLTNPKCVNFMAQQILKNWANDCLYFDGIYFDRVQASVTHLWPEIDIDRDGVADDEPKITSAWQAGVKTLLTRIRDSAPNAIICANDAIHAYGPWLNGRLFELGLSDISAGRRSFWPFLQEYLGWNEVHRQPWALPLMTGMGPDYLFTKYGNSPWKTCPSDTIEWVKTRFQRMRFGLCTTLMGDGLFTYDFGTTWWGHDWWYDEYEAPLGMPAGLAYPLTEQAQLYTYDDFEDGTFGNFCQPSWNKLAQISQEPDKIVSGQYSIVADNVDPNSVWNEFLWSDIQKIRFQPQKTYTIFWKYKILRAADQGNFYANLRHRSGNNIQDVWYGAWDPPAGKIDSTYAVMKVGDSENYYLLFGIKNDGAIAIDEITIYEGSLPVWRRDFTGGLTLVNPGFDTAAVVLEKPYQAISGFQDPLINHGKNLQSLKLAPFDGCILLRGTQNIIDRAQTEKSEIPLWYIFPSPFNQITRIRIRLAKACHVKLAMYDVLGRQVRLLINENLPAGITELDWDGLNEQRQFCASGIYFVEFRSDSFHNVKKVLLLR